MFTFLAPMVIVLCLTGCFGKFNSKVMVITDDLSNTFRIEMKKKNHIYNSLKQISYILFQPKRISGTLIELMVS